MNNQAYYKLYCLINVFKVIPAFLLPIFTDENNTLYFQKINDNNPNKIQFVKISNADFEEFKSTSQVIYLNFQEYLFLGDDINNKNITEPIRAVQSEKITVFISNTKKMVDYLKSQTFLDTKFNEEVKRFIQKYNI